MIETNSQLNQEILNSLGLDVQKVAHHYKKIHQVLSGELSTSLPIVEACSLENGGIVSWDALSQLVQNLAAYKLFHTSTPLLRRQWIQNFIVTCIPAAGAAARYWKGANADYCTSYAQFPKALLPATLEGDSFLDIKLKEQIHLMPTYANCMIVPFGLQKTFQTIIGSSPWFIVEQTKALSTIRFHLDGTPYLTNENIYSPVPAGHGELLYLFDETLNHFPNSCALHLRNIDNIIGIHPERTEELSLLAESFYLIRCALDVIRVQVKKFIQNPELGTYVKDDFYLSAVDFLQDCCPCLMPKIECISKENWEDFLHEINKPLSVFGMVKKEERDQGGGAVFAKMPDGKVIKICLEMSHASEHEREEYFGKKGKLPYFNPVLVFFETQTGMGEKTKFKNLFDDNFWLLSKRHYLNSQVCYHETILYELIGNSEKTNVVFIEVPRTLFKPHKYFLDSIGKTREFYGL